MPPDRKPPKRVVACVASDRLAEVCALVRVYAQRDAMVLSLLREFGLADKMMLRGGCLP
jgi:hypothetical protein